MCDKNRNQCDFMKHMNWCLIAKNGDNISHQVFAISCCSSAHGNIGTRVFICTILNSVSLGVVFKCISIKKCINQKNGLMHNNFIQSPVCHKAKNNLVYNKLY